MDYNKLSSDELKNGYRFDRDKNAYVCNYCEKDFHIGQVYLVGSSYFMPEYATQQHINAEHSGNCKQLLYSESKYNTLTDNQKELLSLLHSGMSDNEIAKKLGVSTSTVRRQKFTFREKAKQAKLFLAIFESVFDEKTENKEDIIPIHDNAKYLDDRYVITETENERILKTSFECMEPLILNIFPAKEKKKVVVLTKIAEQFKRGLKYTEKEVNQILKPIYEDYIIIRRYLVMYGFMERTNDGSSYWLC